MTGAIAVDPLLPLPLIAALAALSLLIVGLALWRGLRGWWLRLLAAAVVIAALMNPSWRQEDRAPLASVALVVVDETASNRIDERGNLTREAVAEIEARLGRLGEDGAIEYQVIRVPDAGADGSRLLSALAEAAAELSPDRIAGAVLVTDGQVHDAGALDEFPAPVHVLLTGSEREWDRRVVVETAPAFAIVGEPVEVSLRLEDLGMAPEGAGLVDLSIALNGEEPERFTIPVGQSVTLPVTLERAGQNVLEIATPEVEGELTARNNAAIVALNGVRDRLRVLLVSGEPYAGERTWRNLLKSDSAVDLVHFTILRPPDKQDFVPVFELSLIAFPTQELFMEKVDEFDLIIFDRYKRRGILPNSYFDNIVRYVRDGGALLIASGADFAGPESLYRSPLQEVLPVTPTARVVEEGFHPRVAELGERHPVTEGLDEHAPRNSAQDGTPGWGRWFRAVEVEAAPDAQVVMEGPDGTPLLVLDRVGEGRIAMLASDQAWLWSRGYEGGGPQLELLRRLAHWMMGEPELEEEALVVSGTGGEVTVTRRTLGQDVPPLRLESPAGETRELAMTEVGSGRWQAEFEGGENGVWRLTNGDLTAVAVVGPAAPKEFENPISTGEILAPLAEATRGAVRRLEDGVPELRLVREGRVADGRGWIGLTDRQAYQLRDIRLVPLAPGWLMLLLASGMVFAAWRIEGR